MTFNILAAISFKRVIWLLTEARLEVNILVHMQSPISRFLVTRKKIEKKKKKERHYKIPVC